MEKIFKSLEKVFRWKNSFEVEQSNSGMNTKKSLPVDF